MVTIRAQYLGYRISEDSDLLVSKEAVCLSAKAERNKSDVSLPGKGWSASQTKDHGCASYPWAFWFI